MRVLKVAPEFSRYINILGYKMHYLTCGKGPAIAFIHGSGTDSYSWRNNVHALSKYFKLYVLDLIGSGDSDKPKTNYCLSFFTQQIYQFLQKVRIRKIILVGASWGGALALSFAIEFPKIVDKLIIIDSITPYPIVKGIKASQKRFKALTQINQGKKSTEWGRKILEELLKEGYYNQEAVTNEVVNRQFKMWKTAEGRTAQIAIRSQCDFREIIGEVGTIQQKVLLIWGEKDPWHPLAAAKQLQKKIKKSKLVIVPNAGHAPHETHPDSVNQAILRFLRTH